MQKIQERFGENNIGDVDELMMRIDIDGSGTIDIKEFITAAINLQEVTKESKLKQAFNLLDLVNHYNLCQLQQDGNGSISQKELERVLGAIVHFSEQEWGGFCE